MSPQPVKYCADCGAVIAGADTETHRYNRIRYCDRCAKARKLWSNANSQKQFRLDRKEYNRLRNEQIRLLRLENAELRQYTNVLLRMNQEARGYV